MIRFLLRDWLQTQFPSVSFFIDQAPALPGLAVALVATAGAPADAKFAIDRNGIQFFIKSPNRLQAAQFAEQLITFLQHQSLELIDTSSSIWRILDIEITGSGAVYLGEENGISFYSVNAILFVVRPFSATGAREGV